MGHVHLQVSEIPDTVAFYRDLLGFDLMAQLGEPGGVPQRRRLPPPPRREHVGERRCGPPPPGAATLRHATIVLPDAAERDRVAGALSRRRARARGHGDGPIVRDPSGNALLLAVA